MRYPLASRRVLGHLAVVLVCSLGLSLSGLTGTVRTSAAAAPVPATPSGLPSGIEALQPFVGQRVCDPVAKPGVRAFASMVLDTYRVTRSLGIVRDCGAGGTSEHKEGRGWDWGVNSFDPQQKEMGDRLTAWLLETDSAGNKYAMARRTGVMYMIWNKRIWKAYAAEQGWQPYSGPNPHTDHVHFSFGWNGAKQNTSFWTKKVAAIDYGPTGAPPVVPVRHPNNLQVTSRYGSTTQTSGSSGEAVKALQRGLLITADGSFGTGTRTAVERFQDSQTMSVTGRFGPTEWRRLFPPPIVPFGSVDAITDSSAGTTLRGWAVDADTSSPLTLHVWVGNAPFAAVTANTSRSDVETTYPGSGTNRGFSSTLDLPDGRQRVCVYAINVGPGSNTLLSCRDLTITHNPVGVVDKATPKPGSLSMRGWGLDLDASGPVDVVVTHGTAVVGTAKADTLRSDVGTHYPQQGDRRGFDFTQSLASVPEGTPELCATLRNVGRGVDTRLSCVRVPVRHQPFGSFDTAQVRPGEIALRGWAIEPDGVDPASLRVTVGGVPQPVATASSPRPDVAGAFPFYGGRNGFDLTLPTPAAEGRQEVCVTVLNKGPGTDAALGCRTIDVTHRPFGSFDSVTAAGGALSLSGWAIDPDTASPIGVHVYVDGVPAAGLRAEASRPDVAGAFPGYGDRHGFAAALPGSYARGSHQVCVYAINSGAGNDNPLLSCRTVTVA